MHPIFALGLPGLPELVLIFLVVLVLFGAKRLPELARGLGSSMKEFRKAKDEFENELHRSADQTDKAPPTAPAVAAVPVQPAAEVPVKPV